MSDQETPDVTPENDDGVIETGEPTAGEDGELQVLDRKAVEYATKRDKAIGLIYRIRIQGLTPAEAWRQVSVPNKLTGSDKTHAESASRLLKWFNENYSEDLQKYLDRANVGRHAITDTLRQMLHATKFCPHTRCQIPDWRVRGQAVRMLIQINPEIINVMRRARGNQGAPIGDPNSADAEIISMIVSGKKFKTNEEWLAFADAVNRKEAERQAAIARRERKAASDSIAEANGEADGKPFTAEEMI